MHAATLRFDGVEPLQGRGTWAGGSLEGAPAGVSPRAKAGALDARPPWEAPHLGGPGILDAGKDRKSNAEITPLEVLKTALPPFDIHFPTMFGLSSTWDHHCSMLAYITVIV